ncbi:molybdopterin dinucleotide binding domain-containing protein [Flaviflexus sp.]|uniref:molybdopterin dinucleotide binding domain-containing protein n=1 Tax=Flaviflexus sp. TaxID=1969482 RepID=UPI00352C86B1
MTASALHSDLVLPGTTNAEEDDFIASEYAGDTTYAIMVDQAIDPLYEAKSHYDMCTLIAEKYGIKDEFAEGRTQSEWRSFLIDETRKEVPDLWTEEEFHERGVFRVSNPNGTDVAQKAFREDPEANPLETPSGKIEIYSQQLADMAKEWEFPDAEPGDLLIPLPEYVKTWESAEEARTNEKYPLQLIGHHYKGRTHSSYASVDWTVEAHPQKVWISQKDAEERGIKSEDMVHVFNDRGRIELPAFVTPRIMPGVLSVPQGAWYKPDGDVDKGGCVNTLTRIKASPLSKGNPQHTNLVQVEKVR